MGEIIVENSSKLIATAYQPRRAVVKTGSMEGSKCAGGVRVLPPITQRHEVALR